MKEKMMMTSHGTSGSSPPVPPCPFYTSYHIVIGDDEWLYTPLILDAMQ
jgi:hypothetical protein